MILLKTSEKEEIITDMKKKEQMGVVENMATNNKLEQEINDLCNRLKSMSMEPFKNTIIADMLRQKSRRKLKQGD